MLEPVLTLGCILFFIVLTYSFQMRQRKYKNYPTSCDVLYYPEKEEILMVEDLYESSPMPALPFFKDTVNPEIYSQKIIGF